MEENNSEKQKVKKPFYKKWWLWVIVIVVVLAIIGSVFGTNTSNTNNGLDDSVNNDANADTGYYIGDTVQNKDIFFRVDNVYNTQTLGSQYVGETTLNNFIVVDITIKNIGDQEYSFTSSNFKLKKGKTTYETHSGGIYLENGFYIIEKVGPGITKRLSLVFETPTNDIENYILVVKGGSWTKGSEIKLVQKS